MATQDDQSLPVASYGQAAGLALMATAGGLAGGLVAGSEGAVAGSAAGTVFAALLAQHHESGQDRALRTLELASITDTSAWLADTDRADLLFRAVRAGFESSTDDKVQALAAVCARSTRTMSVSTMHSSSSTASPSSTHPTSARCDLWRTSRAWC